MLATKFLKLYLPTPLKVFLGEVLALFSRDASVARFCAHNRQIWKKQENEGGVILFDAFPVAQSVITTSYFLNVLAKKHKAAFRPFSYLGINNPHLRHLYQSFGAGPEVLTRLTNKAVKERATEITDTIFSGLKTKEDVFQIKVNGYPVGIDIYESYLRFCGRPTVYIEGKLRGIVAEAVELVLFWEDFFQKQPVHALVLSHCCYNHLNIPAKIAFQKNIPVYVPYARGIYRLTRPLESYGYFPHLRKMFARLSPQEQKEAKALAKRQIERRLSGEVGVDMGYSTKSGYSRSRTAQRLLGQNNKIKVLIASHCFYDNPYAFGDLLFIDFYEWITFLGKLAEETDYEWYLKMHPDPFPGTEETMKELLAKYPRIKMLPKETSHMQLVEEGLNFVLTAYGSVGHEYPALGVQVINAGYNPREAYNFNWHPKTVEEYRSLLLRLKELKLDVRLDDLYEFYYLYHYYIYADDFIFPNYREAEKKMGGHRGMSTSAAYDYFLDLFTSERHQTIQQNILDFVESGAKYFFSRGIERDLEAPALRPPTLQAEIQEL